MSLEPERKPRQLPDQSYWTEQIPDLTRLARIEKLIANYANGLMNKLGKYDPLPDVSTNTGPVKTGFYPHGVVDFKKNSFVAKTGLGPTKKEEIAPQAPGAPQAELRIIETSGELTLTQPVDYYTCTMHPSEHSRTPGKCPICSMALVPKYVGDTIEHCFPYDGSTHLIVFGNAVRIRGKISAPGKHIVIFARELRTVANDREGAELNVDGAPPPSAPIRDAQRAKTGDKGTDAKIQWINTSGGRRPTNLESIWAGKGVVGDNGQDGNPGGPGMPAGNIYIVCDALQDNSDLTLSAVGGAGQGGQAGQNGGHGGSPGGNYAHMELTEGEIYVKSAIGGEGGRGGRGGPGGAGGNGGNCIVIFNKAASGAELAKGPIQVIAGPGTAGGRGAEGADGDPGRRGTDDKTVLNWCMQNRFITGWSVTILPSAVDDSEEQAVNPTRDARPELPGPLPAKWGRYLLVHNVGVTSVADTKKHDFTDLRGLAQVSHLHKVMETARARYLAWDAYRFAKDQRAEKFKQELITLLDFLNLGLRLLSSVSEDDAKIRDGIGDAVRNLAIQVARDQDYFGQPENVVPLGPPKKELKEFTDSLTNLKDQEGVYFDYLDALRTGNELEKQRGKALDAAEGAIGELQKTHGALRTTLIGFVGDRNKKGLIEEAQNAFENARRALEPKLTGLREWVKTCSGLSTEDYLNCVFNLAFLGSPINENAAGKTVLSGHGVFTGITTLTSQVGTLITKAVETLPNDEGQPVRRERLLKQVDKFSKKLDNLKEAWTTIQNARHPSDPAMVQLDDPDAYRLLVAQKDFDTLLDQFSTKPEAEAAMAAMDAYVDAVQERNAVLGEYNALVAEFLRVAGEIRAGELHQDSVKQSISQGAQPNAQAEMAFITALYNRARERCIAYYYLASRAQRFWSLGSDDSLYKTLHLGSINQIDYNTLKDAEQNLFTNRVNTIQATLQNPESHFPPLKQVDGAGKYFALKRKVYKLRVLEAKTAAQIPSKGRETVILALAGTNLHIRIFDHTDTKVVDQNEQEPAYAGKLLALKQRVAALLRRDVSAGGILRAGKWYTQDELNAMPAEKKFEALTEKVSQLVKGPQASGLRTHVSELEVRYLGAVAVFLLRAKIVAEGVLKGMDDAQQRVLLRKETVKHSGLSEVEVSSRNWHEIVKTGLTWADADFDLTDLIELSDIEEQEIIGAAAAATEHPLPPAYPGEIAELKKNGRATFLIPAPTKESSVDDNPFAPYYNVRLTRVRAWIPGVKTGDSMVLVNLTHKGPELIRASDKSLVPFVHKDVSFPFQYNWKKVRWDEDTHQIANVAEVLASDTNLRVKIEGDDTEYLEMIGPFAEWEIAVTDVNNKKPVDRSQIETIYLEFHGFGQTKDPGPR